MTTLLADKADCMGCPEGGTLVRAEDGTWRHPGGRDVLACYGCGHHLGSESLGLRNPCRKCGEHDWRYHHSAEAAPQPEPVSAEARRIGVRALVDIGWSAYSDARTDSTGERRGGVICAIDERVDDGRELVYLCVDLSQRTPRFVRIRESEIGPDGFEAPNDGRLRLAIARLLRAVVDDLMTRDGRVLALTPRIAERIAQASRLTGVVMGGRG